MKTTPLLLAATLAGCAASAQPAPPASPTAPEVRAVEVEQPPVVDGLANDAAWEAAPETEVPLFGFIGPSSCLVRAVTCRGSLHLLVRWKDATEDREQRPWVRGADGAWARGKEIEDALSVAFPMEGEFTANMLSPLYATWDVWHWKAFRTDPTGHAQDRMHVMSLVDPGGERHDQRLPDGRTVYIRRPEDAGGPFSEALPAPTTGDRGPSYASRPVSGSAADVVAQGKWADGWWTVEFARALRTGNPDDRDLHGLGEIPFALAVLDHAEDEDHATSRPIRLLLPATPAPAAEPPSPPGATR
jgi:hypothetical protein